MHDKLLTYINLVLILICGACVLFLSMDTYSKPKEISTMEALARKLQNPRAPEPRDETLYGGAETDFNRVPGAPETDPNRVPAGPYSNLNKNPYFPFYTPTPSPTPTPPPPPPDPVLELMTRYWKVLSLNDGSADFSDEGTKAEFTMTVGGPPHMTMWTDGVEYPVKLEKVDMDNFAAVVTFRTQRRPIPLQ